MASSSDWLAISQDARETETDGVKASSWLDSLVESDGFVEGWPLSSKSVRAADATITIEPEINAPDPLEEAFARGEAAGRAEAAKEVEEHNNNQRALRLTFRNLDQAAMDALATELSDTVIALCSKAFADFEPDAENLATRCKDAAKRLGSGASGARLHLHPDDIALVDRETLEQWEITPDAQMARGGLRFESADGSIGDGPSEWRRAIALALRG